MMVFCFVCFLFSIVEFSWPPVIGADYYELCSRPDSGSSWDCESVGNVVKHQTEPEPNKFYGVRACNWFTCGDVQNVNDNGNEISTSVPGSPEFFFAVRL